MTALRADATRPLTETEAALHAGVDAETLWAWRAMGLIEPVMTPRGPRYPQAAIAAVLAGDTLPRRPRWTTSHWAGRILGCGPGTLRRYERLGLLHAAGRSRRQYELGELEALRDAMAAAEPAD